MSIPRLHFVTDDRQSRADTVRIADAAVGAGVELVQVRMKSATAADFIETVLAVAGAVGDRVPVIVNDRVDVALAARRRGAKVAGAHVGQSDIDPVTARDLLGPEAIVGLTANRPEHYRAANALPRGTVDYLGTGTIHPTKTKPDAPPSLGVEGFAALCDTTRVACIAIGGVVPDDVGPLRAAGAAGIALVSAISLAPHPATAVQTYLAALDAADRDAPEHAAHRTIVNRDDRSTR